MRVQARCIQKSAAYHVPGVTEFTITFYCPQTLTRNGLTIDRYKFKDEDEFNNFRIGAWYVIDTTDLGQTVTPFIELPR